MSRTNEIDKPKESNRSEIQRFVLMSIMAIVGGLSILGFHDRALAKNSGNENKEVIRTIDKTRAKCSRAFDAVERKRNIFSNLMHFSDKDGIVRIADELGSGCQCEAYSKGVKCETIIMDEPSDDYFLSFANSAPSGKSTDGAESSTALSRDAGSSIWGFTTTDDVKAHATKTAEQLIAEMKKLGTKINK